jgi:glycosyltransferase involved in cell wall biosynthesis
MNRNSEKLEVKGKLQISVCMISYSFYESDGRVMRYAETLSQVGARVDIFCLGRPGQGRRETICGVNVFRVQNRTKNEISKYTYLYRIIRFLISAFLAISFRHGMCRYKLAHVHSVPDFSVFAAIVPKLFSAKVILDIHDIVPEFYGAKFNVAPTSVAFRALLLLEKTCCRFANHVIVANDLWHDKLVKRAVEPSRCSSYINYPDLKIFNPSLREDRTTGSQFVLIYPGTLNWHQGLDIAIHAFAIAVESAPDMHFYIYGEGSSKLQLQRLVEELDLTGKVTLRSPVPLHEIASIMANADLGVVPKRNDPFGGDAFSTKVLEFMALGVPVLLSETRVDRHYFNESLVRFFTPSDHLSLAAAMIDAYRDRVANAKMAERALDFARKNSWDAKSRDYLALVEGLLNART